jgi:hypothetical protein
VRHATARRGIADNSPGPLRKRHISLRAPTPPTPAGASWQQVAAIVRLLLDRLWGSGRVVACSKTFPSPKIRRHAPVVVLFTTSLPSTKSKIRTMSGSSARVAGRSKIGSATKIISSRAAQMTLNAPRCRPRDAPHLRGQCHRHRAKTHFHSRRVGLPYLFGRLIVFPWILYASAAR